MSNDSVNITNRSINIKNQGDLYDFFIRQNFIINQHLANDGGECKLKDVVKEFFDYDNDDDKIKIEIKKGAWAPQKAHSTNKDNSAADNNDTPRDQQGVSLL